MKTLFVLATLAGFAVSTLPSAFATNQNGTGASYNNGQGNGGSATYGGNQGTNEKSVGNSYSPS